MRLSLLLLAALISSEAFAESNAPATLSCYFQTGESFTVVGQNGTTMIQWGNNGFRAAASAYEDPWLTVVERADNGNLFKMAFNVRTKDAFGETTFTDGHKKGGPLWCVFR
jgi:hypothetical protein